MFFKTDTKGFTLIELLVVISIISLLSSIVLTTLSEVGERGRDTKRVAELKQLSTALELYFNEYGCYPFATQNASNASTLSNPCRTGNSVLVGATCSQNNNHFETSLQVLVDAGFITSLPVDPINGNTAEGTFCYNYTRHRPTQSGWFCGSNRRTDFAYSITFAVENSSFNLLESNGTGYDYCVVGQEYPF